MSSEYKRTSGEEMTKDRKIDEKIKRRPNVLASFLKKKMSLIKSRSNKNKDKKKNKVLSLKREKK